MTDLYKTLEVNSKASIQEIKKSYRRLAKKLHPDVNKAADSHEKFIEINEAYEFLVNQKLGLTYDSKKKKYTRSSKATGWEEWSRNEKEKANQRARYYSTRKYKDFKNSAFYKESQAIESFGTFGLLLLLFCFIVVFPAYLSYTYDLPGIFISLVIGFFTIQLWGPILVSGKLPGFASILEGFRLISGSFSFMIFISCFLFFVIFFTLGFQTFISIYEIVLYLLILASLSFFLTRNRYNGHTLARRILRSMSYALLLFSVLICINYFISFSSQKESYIYSSTKQIGGRGQRLVKGSMILLEGDKYDFYPSVRFFFDYSSIPGNGGEITYRTKEGILFYKIYTNRVF